MLLCVIILFVCTVCEGNSTEQCPNVKTSFGALRKRRHLVFPDSTNIVLTISLVKAFMTHAPSGWNIALEIDVLFPLPDEKFLNEHRRKKNHRQKREFWERLENAIDLHNLNGRACILRSICESERHLAPPGKSLVHDLLRAIFSSPIENEEFINEVGDTYREMLEPKFCDHRYDCPFSILSFVLALGKQK
ncbi:uncharacterized protein LOC119839768 [Zerene cesonia]|uniref:uncharacterized protein LOC119839768 n=1 Tax=Zerene cesonia TaxID=33412 RepID=UPI0018E55765|nr:uncharacterized protein LOC119839768 [Zerene cesonia]